MLRTVAAMLLLAANAAIADTTFDSAEALKDWKTTGDVTVDTEKDHGKDGGSLRVGPKASAILKVADSNSAGKVEFWVFDDLTAPQNPKERAAGPRWGLVSADGRQLVVGALYAPYLSGDTTYAASDSDGKAPLAGVQYTAAKRQSGWHKWTFDFNAEKGLSILMDGKAVRFDWNQTQFKGFNGVGIFGDAAGEQMVWVDDIAAAPGGQMAAAPTPPPPPPPATPDQDPAATRQVKLVPAVAGKHPRLLFTEQDIPAMKKLVQGQGKPFYDQLLAYLPPSKSPGNTKFQTDATDGQRQGMWRLPTVSLHYVLTGDKGSFEEARKFLQFLVETENWETGQELDAGMSAANIMVGAALAYDWLYNDLDPEFREKVRDKLLLQARRMYHGGHLKKVGKVHYWQNDPANNHRWHRDAGLALCVLAVADENRSDDDWMIEMLTDELDLLNKWMPEDGSSHESPSYLVFGGPYVTLAFDASDRCLGTDYLGSDFFKNTPEYRVQTTLPGFKDAFGYGDSGGFGAYNSFNFAATRRHKLADEQAGLMKLYQTSPDAFLWGWMSIVWFDASLEGGKLENIPKSKLFDDIGVAFMRDGWTEDSVAVMFKSSPYGGATLNRYRNENNFAYINVAHDDPDANMIVLYANGKVLAENDGYATNKTTESHNTILVNGKGQLGEGDHWTQPLKGKDKDMADLASITGWQEGKGITVVEGEAGNAYADLTGYRRTVVWAEGRYILMLDSITATPGKQPEITWLMQGVEVTKPDGNGKFRLSDGNVGADVIVAASKPFEANVVDAIAETRGKPLGFKQLQLSAKAEQWELASVMDPWQKGVSDVKLTDAGNGKMTVTVTVGGKTEQWTWTPADNNSPTKLSGNGLTFESNRD